MLQEENRDGMIKKKFCRGIYEKTIPNQEIVDFFSYVFASFIRM